MRYRYIVCLNHDPNFNLVSHFIFNLWIRRWFSYRKYESFKRQLNIYDFKRIKSGVDKNCYFHKDFIRGQYHRAERIHRVPVKKVGVQTNSLARTPIPDLNEMSTHSAFGIERPMLTVATGQAMSSDMFNRSVGEIYDQYFTTVTNFANQPTGNVRHGTGSTSDRSGDQYSELNTAITQHLRDARMNSMSAVTANMEAQRATSHRSDDINTAITQYLRDTLMNNTSVPTTDVGAQHATSHTPVDLNAIVTRYLRDARMNSMSAVTANMEAQRATSHRSDDINTAITQYLRDTLMNNTSVPTTDVGAQHATSHTPVDLNAIVTRYLRDARMNSMSAVTANMEAQTTTSHRSGDQYRDVANSTITPYLHDALVSGTSTSTTSMEGILSALQMQPTTHLSNVPMALQLLQPTAAQFLTNPSPPQSSLLSNLQLELF